MTAAATVDVTLAANGPVPVALTTKVYDDATPQVSTSTNFDDHYNGVLTGTADTVLLWTTPTQSGKTWTIGNADHIYATEEYAPTEHDKKGIYPLHDVCAHHATAAIGPFSGSLPIILFNRSDTPVPVTVQLKR